MNRNLNDRVCFGLSALCAFGMLLAVICGSGAANADSSVSPKATSMTILVELDTPDSGWVIASNIPESVMEQSRGAKAHPEMRRIITQELRAREIAPTDTIVNALVRRVLRRDFIMDLANRYIIVLKNNSTTGVTIIGFNGDADPEELSRVRERVKEEQRDRAAIVTEIRRQFPPSKTDTGAVAR